MDGVDDDWAFFIPFAFTLIDILGQGCIAGGIGFFFPLSFISFSHNMIYRYLPPYRYIITLVDITKFLRALGSN